MDDALVKLCPACNEDNPVSEVICRVCMTNLTSVSPTLKGGKPEFFSEPEPEKKPLPVLSLSRLSDGRILPVADGTILGRNGETSSFFYDERTVSRLHAKLSFQAGEWRVEDLNSMNGTWINDKKLPPGLPYPLKGGDTISLSLACKLRVL